MLLDQPDLQPVRGRFHLVVQQQRPALAVHNQKIDAPIVIVVADGKSAADDPARKVRSRLAAHLFEHDAPALAGTPVP